MSFPYDHRDFKGVWIPRDIWLSSDLTMLEKVLFTEISSLDNEEFGHCTASNGYFAEFCNCGTATITRAISHLKELGLIEELPYNGRNRALRVIKMISQTNQNDYSDKSKRLAININSNIENNKTISKEIVADAPTESSHRKSLVTPKTSPLVKPKKKNLYDSCIEAIEEFTEDEEIRDKLKEYLSVRLERKDKPFGIKTFQSTLKKLRTLTDKKTEALQIIQYSIDGQYGTFYELKKNNGYRRQPRGAEISGEYGIVKTGGDTEEKIINVQF